MRTWPAGCSLHPPNPSNLAGNSASTAFSAARESRSCNSLFCDVDGRRWPAWPAEEQGQGQLWAALASRFGQLRPQHASPGGPQGVRGARAHVLVQGPPPATAATGISEQELFGFADGPLLTAPLPRANAIGRGSGQNSIENFSVASSLTACVTPPRFRSPAEENGRDNCQLPRN